MYYHIENWVWICWSVSIYSQDSNARRAPFCMCQALSNHWRPLASSGDLTIHNSNAIVQTWKYYIAFVVIGLYTSSHPTALASQLLGLQEWANTPLTLFSLRCALNFLEAEKWRAYTFVFRSGNALAYFAYSACPLLVQLLYHIAFQSSLWYCVHFYT